MLYSLALGTRTQPLNHFRTPFIVRFPQNSTRGNPEVIKKLISYNPYQQHHKFPSGFTQAGLECLMNLLHILIIFIKIFYQLQVSIFPTCHLKDLKYNEDFYFTTKFSTTFQLKIFFLQNNSLFRVKTILEVKKSEEAKTKFSRSAKIFVCSQFCFCGKNKFIYFSPVFDQKQKKSGQNYFCEVFVAFAKTVKIRILH